MANVAVQLASEIQDQASRTYEAAKQLRVLAEQWSTGQPLVGYLDVPAYATALRFQAALDKSLGDCSSTSISLYTRAGATTRLISGNTPWTEIALDLTAARGDRAVLRATPSRYSPCAPGMYEMLVLDGFRVE